MLDIATGTGIWAIQFANEHPQANVIGTDISLIQPDGPPNVSWVREDAENQEWTLPHLFDYIHVRAVLSCFDNHRIVIQKAYDSLEPGGWLEMMDPTFQMMCTDGTCTGTNIERYWNLILEAGRSVGRDFCVATKYRQWLNEIGFVDVVEEVGPMPGKSCSPPGLRTSGNDSDTDVPSAADHFVSQKIKGTHGPVIRGSRKLADGCW